VIDRSRQLGWSDSLREVLGARVIPKPYALALMADQVRHISLSMTRRTAVIAHSRIQSVKRVGAPPRREQGKAECKGRDRKEDPGYPRADLLGTPQSALLHSISF
jgi:hypothetical protein